MTTNSNLHPSPSLPPPMHAGRFRIGADQRFEGMIRLAAWLALHWLIAVTRRLLGRGVA